MASKMKKFSTPVGAIMSCLTMTLFFSFFMVRTLQLKNSDDPDLTMIEIASEQDYINLHELNFFFAIVYNLFDLVVSTLRCLCLRKNRSLLRNDTSGEIQQYY